MNDYFIYYGVKSGGEDWEDPPTHQIKKLGSQHEVNEEFAKFLEEYDLPDLENYDKEYWSDVTFRVFKGKELQVKPVEKITKYEISE